MATIRCWRSPATTRCAVSAWNCGCTASIPMRRRRAAHKLDYTVLQAPADKPHGLREAYIVDPDGYVWVPDVPITK